jgi:anti-sigma factor RsiW
MREHYDDLLDARLDGELTAEEAREVDQHLATCSMCAQDYASLSATHRLLSDNLVRYEAPDVLKARIRTALVDTARPTPVARASRPWWRMAAAGVAIAVVSSTLTLVTVRRSDDARATDELLASHIRSLQPGHLTDVVATNQHTVKPWFNGRVDISPAVPNLDSLGFPLVGGRTDYVRGRAVPVMVYARRQHMINVYAWPSSDAASSPSRAGSRNGYHFVTWHSGELAYEAVSDLNAKELDSFSAAFFAASGK